MVPRLPRPQALASPFDLPLRVGTSGLDSGWFGFLRRLVSGVLCGPRFSGFMLLGGLGISGGFPSRPHGLEQNPDSLDLSFPGPRFVAV